MQQEIMQRAADFLGEEGPFCQQISGYQVRENQLALCDAIDDALAAGSHQIMHPGLQLQDHFW